MNFFLFTDETNTTASTSLGVKFFAYGGLIIAEDKLEELHVGVESIRTKHGFASGDEFKFDTRSRPDRVSAEAHATAKNEVIELCISLECKFIAYVVLHDIARKVPRYITWGADSVIGKFNYFLRLSGSRGYVVIDRLSNRAEYDYLAEKFVSGLIMPTGKVPLDRIVLFSSTCNNASHASSAMDIVLGTFRYCINNPSNVQVAKVMMGNMTKLIWADRLANGNLDALDKGLIFRPRNVKILEYKAEYDELLSHINSLLQ